MQHKKNPLKYELFAFGALLLSGLAAPSPVLRWAGPLALLGVMAAAVVYTWLAEGPTRGREAAHVAAGVLSAPLRAPGVVGRAAWRSRRVWAVRLPMQRRTYRVLRAAWVRRRGALRARTGRWRRVNTPRAPSCDGGECEPPWPRVAVLALLSGEAAPVAWVLQ
jgi:hypothetical protein